MSKKEIIIGIIGVLTLSFLAFPTLTYADQYYDQYPGNGFLPADESLSYYRNWEYGYMFHNDYSDGNYTCSVNFNIPDGSIYFIKSIGMRFYDDRADGVLEVRLRRLNLYTGAVHTVAFWSSGLTEASGSYQTASQGTNAGYKLIDTKKFAYWLEAFFFVLGDVVNPGVELRLCQVRIHYGT